MFDTRFSKFTLQQILEKTKYTKRQTKIVCTIGLNSYLFKLSQSPSCWSKEQLIQLIHSGMDVARLNFSHGDHKAHAEVLQRIVEAEKFCSACHCPIMLDTKKIIRGQKQELDCFRIKLLLCIKIKNSQQVAYFKDNKYYLKKAQDYTFIGNEQKIACSYDQLSKSMKIGDQILIADGSLVCEVMEILENGLKVKAKNGATIGERKNMNLPGVKIDIPTVTEKDKDDIVNFALKYPIKLIALSFTRSAADIETVRELLGEQRSTIKIIAKIENQEGLNNYDEILEAADGIMVARGDLGMEIPAQKVFVAQKWMIKKANLLGKPVITATQMMESMVKNPRPTRAEASDVANAVLDGTSAVMLSGETAGGEYPFEALETMAQICSEAELCFDNENIYLSMLREKQLMAHTIDDVEAIASAAVQLSFDVNAKLIITFTESGLMVRMVAKYFPKACIFAVGFFEKFLKGLSLFRGVRALRLPKNYETIDEMIQYAIEFAKEMNRIKEGDKVIIVQGFTEIRQDNPLNMLKIMTI